MNKGLFVHRALFSIFVLVGGLACGRAGLAVLCAVCIWSCAVPWLVVWGEENACGRLSLFLVDASTREGWTVGVFS